MSTQREVNAKIELIIFRLNDIIDEAAKIKKDIHDIRNLVRPDEDVEPD